MLPENDHAQHVIGVETVSVPLSLGRAGQTARFVDAVEADIESRLTAAAQNISRDCCEHDVKVIRLSGPTCSGKTTATGKLTEALQDAGMTVYPVSFDDFFFGRAVLEERARLEGCDPDYDSIDAIDVPKLQSCITELFENGRTRLPLFDFTISKRHGYRVLDIRHDAHPILLFEGIQAVYPEVSAMLSSVRDRSVFISALCNLRVGHTLFCPEDLRLLRRLIRDAALRASSAQFTLGAWKGVRKNEDACILPYADDCDYLIDSTMPYEVHMIAPIARPLLREVPADAPEAAEAARLLAMLDGIEDIPSSLLPAKSLYHEFIPV